jgi:hypothetical protein
MIDWKRYVREHLPRLDVRAEREAEIVDELALQLEAAYDTALAEGAPDVEAIKCAIGEVPDWQALTTSSRLKRGFLRPQPQAS